MMSDFLTLMKKLSVGESLSAEETEFAFAQIFEEQTPAEVVKNFLVFLYNKGESIEELLGAVTFLRKQGVVLQSRHADLIDCCGTGGDQKNTFNISTAVAFVLAGGGCYVAKHGNRAISSQSGSADVLKELGVNIDASFEQTRRCLDEIGIGFLFAPQYYPLLKKMTSIRQSLGHRSIFNIVGPLLNPARAKKQLIGVFDKNLVEMVAVVLQKLGCESAVVVHNDDGLDEISLSSLNTLAILKNNKIQMQRFDARESGYSACTLEDLKGGSAPENAARLKLTLKGHSEPLDHVVHINAAWGFIAAGKALSFMDGMLMAQQSISSGAAYQKLESLIEMSHRTK